MIRQRIFDPLYQIELFFRCSTLYKKLVRSREAMRSFIKDVLRKRVAELTSVDRTQNQQEDEYEKRFRIFVDEIILLSMEEKCFSEDEMISESLTMLLAVSNSDGGTFFVSFVSICTRIFFTLTCH